MVSISVLLAALLIEGGLFAAFTWWRERLHDGRERDLLNRLMARDLAEYHDATAPPQPRDPGRRHNALVRSQQRLNGGGGNPLARPDP